MTSVTVEEDNQMVIQTMQDARPIIEANKTNESICRGRHEACGRAYDRL